MAGELFIADLALITVDLLILIPDLAMLQVLHILPEENLVDMLGWIIITKLAL